MPNCPQDCTCAHQLGIAMLLLGVGRTKLYEMMSSHAIEYVEAGYGRRIRHDVISKWLAARTVR